MKKTSRLLAALIAAAALTAGMGSMMANAEDSMAALSDAAANVGIAEEVDALIAEEQLSAEEASMLTQMLTEADDSEPVYYENYDKLASVIAFMPGVTDGTLAQHGVAYLSGGTIKSCYIRFFVNKNVVDNNLTDLNNYFAPESNVDITAVQNLSSEDTPSLRCYRVYLGVNGSIPAGTTAFYYLLSPTLANVTSEEELYSYTQQNPKYNSTAVTDEKGNYRFKRCLFARGDVNRDGVVDSTDSYLILKEVVQLAEPAPGRSVLNGKLDRQAFRLAADFDGDGDVDILDVTRLNTALMS